MSTYIYGEIAPRDLVVEGVISTNGFLMTPVDPLGLLPHLVGFKSKVFSLDQLLYYNDVSFDDDFSNVLSSLETFTKPDLTSVPAKKPSTIANAII